MTSHVSAVIDWWLMFRISSAVLEHTFTPEQPNRRRRHSSPLKSGECMILWEDFVESPFPYCTYINGIISKTSLNLMKSMVDNSEGWNNVTHRVASLTASRATTHDLEPHFLLSKYNILYPLPCLYLLTTLGNGTR